MQVKVIDVKRNIFYPSVKSAWEVYDPDESYNTFIYKLSQNQFPFLKFEDDPIERIGHSHAVVCLETKKIFLSTREAARQINGQYQGVQRSAKSEGRIAHKGFHFVYAD